MSNDINFKVQLVDFPETAVAVMEHRGAPSQIGSTIKHFIEWRKLNRLPPSKTRTFNLIYDDPSITAPKDFRLDLCCSVSDAIRENDHGIVNKKIPAGKCALIRHIGSDDSIGVLVNYLYADWLLDSDYKLRDFPLYFERVSFFPEVSEGEMITDVYLPVELNE